MHVYLITCLVNGKIYVGQHSKENLQAYFRRVLGWAMSGLTTKPRLYNAIRKYGPDAFIVTSLARPTSKKQMDKMEIFFIRELNAQGESGYNVVAGGGGCLGLKSFLGKKHSKETRERMSRVHAGKKYALGTKQSAEQRARSSARMMGNTFGCNPSPETRKKMAAPHVGNKYFLGKKHTDEARKKISDANKGRPMSPEHRAKIGAKSRGRTMTEAAREKLRIAASNRSPETREKMSKAQMGKKITPEHLTAMRAGFENMSAESRLRMETGYKKSTYVRTPEHAKKIGDALRGKKASKETKAKQSAARKGRKLSPEQCAAIKRGINEKVSPERRSEIARLRNAIRWGKPRT